MVFESTVYPGATEEVCGPVIEEVSGLRCGVDFALGYSPERINPGDREHTFERITKVVSGQDAATLDRVADAYAAVVTAGVHRAQLSRWPRRPRSSRTPSATHNRAHEQLALSSTAETSAPSRARSAAQWNFLRFSPGLVGGHCIGVDPYYLTSKAEEMGYQPQVILSGRRINNGVGAFVAQRTMKMLSRAGVPLSHAKVGILGLTFKENVPDLRNSRIPDIARSERFGSRRWSLSAGAILHRRGEYGVHGARGTRCTGSTRSLASAPKYPEMGWTSCSRCSDGGVVWDVKSGSSCSGTERGLSYWSL